MGPIRLASVWLDGCSGCHMSFLDLDFELAELAGKVELVYSPLVDAKTFPDAVDAVLVEGAVGSPQHERELRHIRERARLVIAFGDCAVTANVPGMRNPFGVDDVLRRAFVENSDAPGGPLPAGLPPLAAKVRPIHEIVPVDVFLPGCPPPTDAIREVLAALLGRQPVGRPAATRFGA